ncbi:eukaryotic translation initiation factor 4 gamma 1-like [Aphidius gifuensis]|uniref:eukaryotic translation initiation factor 4 gamma 1-like n=1 Tax=Aphidius gifuensis TaxID=684658 RepID=UPI001CDBE41A|nr:eukaryotic translation initiation factor 4 gamma 1-like [Aphidius gifuensis]
MKKSRYENLWALPPVKLSEKNTQQFITGGFKRKLMDNDSNLPTIQNKRLCVVETSTSVEINQPRPRCTRPPKIYGLEKKSLDRSLHKQNDSHQYDKAKNGWKPTAGLQINNITADYETQALYKKISCILNKVTAENMDKLIQQVRDLNINFHERLEGFVDLIFDKAVDEPYFAAICAMMCKKLVDLQVDVVDMRQGNKTNFRSLLLTRCQHEFESASVNKSERNAKLKEIDKCNDIEKKRKLIALLNDADRHSCRKAVGNIRFIGELFKQDMIRISIIDRCIKDLLETPVDYNIECLCELLTTIGAKLENSKNSIFNYYFFRMSLLANNKKLSSRVRYMVQDVIDLRARSWKPILQSNNNVSQHTHKAENAGIPTPRLPVSNETNDSPIQAFHEKVRDILNKLTQANIDGSTQQIKLLGINTHEKLKSVVDLVFEKVINEPNFEAVCAALCVYMRNRLRDEQIVGDDIKQNNNKEQEKGLITFQELLSARCENEFESATINEVARRNKLKEIEKSNDIEKKKELTALLNDADHFSCIKSVRYYKFIGELFNRAVLQKNFLKTCANYLLTIPDERKIKCLCELLETIGATLENLKDNYFNSCFSEVTLIAGNEKQSLKVRSMLQDIINLKARNWSPKRVESNPIDQVTGPSKKDDKNIEGVLKMKATNNVNEPTELPTEINKQPYPIATSTSMEANQQTSIALPRSNNTGATTIYISHNKTFDMYRDLPQSPEPETPTRDQSMSMSLPSEGQSIQLPGSSCTNAPINYRSDDKTLDMYSDSPQSPEPETTSQSSTSLIYVIYSHLDEQIKTLINVAIEEFKNKIDHLDYPVFIRRSLEVTMLESSNVREKYWGFVANMITDNVFPLAVFQSEYDKMFEEINDVSPIFWTYKAEILRILVMCGAHPLKELKRTTSVLKKKGLVGNLVGELLKILVASEGQISITDKWHNSGIEWNDLFDTSLEDPDDIIKKYNLQFLTFRVTDPPNEHLLKLLRDSDIDNTLKWIAVNVGEEISRTPKFVRILFTLLLESGIETKYSFYKRNFYQPNRFKIINLLPLIKDYIDGNLESELQCLYALTDVNHRCKNPPGFAYDIIKELHEKDIISLGAFYVWHNGTAATSELIGHDEAKWNLLSQSFWIKYQNSHY